MTNKNHNAPNFPQYSAFAQEYECSQMYTVKAGDTLYSISQAYGIPVSILMNANKILNPYCLRIGQEICIPSYPQLEKEIVPPPRQMQPKEQNQNLQQTQHTQELPQVQDRPPGQHIPPISDIPNMHESPQVPEIPQIRETKQADETAHNHVNHQIQQAPTIQETAPIVPDPKIPEIAQKDSDVVTNNIHTVVKGDTLYMIAKKHGISLEDIMEANPNLDPYNLRIGTKLYIPAPNAAPASASGNIKSEYYFIRLGDTLDSICHRFNFPIQSIMKTNPNMSVADFSVPGTRIHLPK